MFSTPEENHNFVNPADLRDGGYAVVILCLTISMLAVGVRMWTKIRLVRKVLLEDCNSVPSLPEQCRTW